MCEPLGRYAESNVWRAFTPEETALTKANLRRKILVLDSRRDIPPASHVTDEGDE